MTLQPFIILVEHLFRKVNVILMLEDGERIYENVRYVGCHKQDSGYTVTVIDHEKQRLNLSSDEVKFRNTSLLGYLPPKDGLRMQIGDCLLRIS